MEIDHEMSRLAVAAEVVVSAGRDPVARLPLAARQDADDDDANGDAED